MISDTFCLSLKKFCTYVSEPPEICKTLSWLRALCTDFFFKFAKCCMVLPLIKFYQAINNNNNNNNNNNKTYLCRITISVIKNCYQRESCVK